MSSFTFKQSRRRYHMIFWPSMIVYTIACIGGALLQRQFDGNPIWLSVGLTALTILPIFAVLWLIWRYTQETDEYTRLRQLEALAIGGLVTAGASGAIGFLQIYEAIPTFPVFLLLPFFFLSYGGAKFLRGEKDCV